MLTKIKQIDHLTFVYLIEVLLLTLLIVINLSIGYLGPITSINPTIDFFELIKILVLKNPLISSESSIERVIIWDIRVPRILIACLCGTALSISGLLIQAIFKNPLGDPYVLGVSSGASIGVALYFILNLIFINIYLDLSIFAFIGAISSIFTLYTLAKKFTSFHPTQVILIGVAISSIGSSITMFLTYIAGTKLRSIVFWLFGSLSNKSWEEVTIMFLIVSIGILFSYYYNRDLNILLLGSLTAHHLGLNIQQRRKNILLIASLLTAISVAFTGVIGFVGLIVPHIMRSIIGSNHRKLIPATAIAGANFLLFSDIIARTVLFPIELPIGIITAFFGGLFFLYILLSNHQGVSFD